MKRTPRSSTHRSLFPAFVTVVAAACNRTPPLATNPPEPIVDATPNYAPNPPPPAPDASAVPTPPVLLTNPPEVLPADAGSAVAPPVRPPNVAPPVTHIYPSHIPNGARGGLRSVGPMPSPMGPSGRLRAPSRRGVSAGASGAGASAVAEAPRAEASGGVDVVHNHPPGTPCTEITETEIRAALAR